MIIILDANVIFASIIKQDKRYIKILKYADFFIPDFLFWELKKYEKRIISKINAIKEFKEFLKHLFYYIKVLPLLAVSEDNLIKAKELCEDVDIKDFPYIAVTLELNGLFWTNDKKLIKGLNNKGFSNIISSEEIFENYFHEKD